jgi:hypothetical protein
MPLKSQMDARNYTRIRITDYGFDKNTVVDVCRQLKGIGNYQSI